MIRVVPTGDIGFDVILGGGWSLVERLPGRESATVLLRGGTGTGKTLLAVDVALALAKALNGDVVVACVELLPTEYLAQIEAGRSALILQHRGGPPVEEPVVMMLPPEAPVASFSESPRIFCGLLPELGPQPDLVAALESMQKDVVAFNGKPKVFVVDSLIAGYGLGPESPRQHVDAVMKFAAQEGLGLVLCEETTDDAPSAWDFAADTVLALDHSREGGRTILVRKHRYGASATGTHRFEIRGWRQPRVGPRPDAWLGLRRVESVLRHHGWTFLNAHGPPFLHWIKELSPAVSHSYGCSLAVVSSPSLELASKLAFSLLPAEKESQHDIVIDLDPLEFGSEGVSWYGGRVHFLPTRAGVDFAICDLVEYFGRTLFVDSDDERPRRIIVGDLGTVSSADEMAWAEGIGVIATLVAESGWGIPVIAYDSGTPDRLTSLKWRADLLVEAEYRRAADTVAFAYVTSRSQGTNEALSWPSERLKSWPEEIAHFAKLPRSRHFG